MNFVLIFLLSYGFTALLTPMFIRYLKRVKVTELPGKRRILTEKIPRMGGLIIYIVVSFSWLYFYPELNETRPLLISSFFIFLLGLFDDTLGLSYRTKLLSQIVVAIIITFYLSQKYLHLLLFGIVIPKPFDHLVLCSFITIAITSINSLDGQDGIEGLVSNVSLINYSVILFLTISYQSVLLATLIVSLIGSTLAFLKYNNYPTRIILGDTGSLIIGYFLVLCSLLVSLNRNTYVLDLSLPLILLSLPVIDVIRVISQSIFEGHLPSLSYRIHIHHLISQIFDSKKSAVIFIEVLTSISVVISFFYIIGFHTLTAILFFIYILIIIFIKRVSLLVANYFKVPSDFILTKNQLKFRFLKVLASAAASIFFLYLTADSLIGSRSYNPSYYFYMTGMGIIVSSAAVYNHLKGNIKYDFFIFLNLMAFIIITGLGTSLYNNNILIDFNAIDPFTENSFYLFIFMIVFALTINSCLLSPDFQSFCVDLTAANSLIFALLVNFSIPEFRDKQLQIILTEIFSLLILIQLIKTMPRLKSYIFYLSFVLPFGALLKLIIH